MPCGTIYQYIIKKTLTHISLKHVGKYGSSNTEKKPKHWSNQMALPTTHNGHGEFERLFYVYPQVGLVFGDN